MTEKVALEGHTTFGPMTATQSYRCALVATLSQRRRQIS